MISEEKYLAYTSCKAVVSDKNSSVYLTDDFRNNISLLLSTIDELSEQIIDANKLLIRNSDDTDNIILSNRLFKDSFDMTLKEYFDKYGKEI